MLAYGSRALSKFEHNYCVTRREFLAVVHFVKHFNHYLYWQRFTIRTDHASLKWFLNSRNPEGQFARWIETLGAYDFEICHRSGKSHGNADALSRIPCKQCGRTSKVAGTHKKQNADENEKRRVSPLKEEPVRQVVEATKGPQGTSGDKDGKEKRKDDSKSGETVTGCDEIVISWTEVDMAKAQRNDKDLGTVITWMEASEERPA